MVKGTPKLLVFSPQSETSVKVKFLIHSSHHSNSSFSQLSQPVYFVTRKHVKGQLPAYQNVLTIAQSVSSIYGVYRCTVGNARGTFSALEVRGECTDCGKAFSIPR